MGKSMKLIVATVTIIAAIQSHKEMVFNGHSDFAKWFILSLFTCLSLYFTKDYFKA